MATKTYTNVENVPLMRTGTWDASTGEISVTKEMLQQAVDATESPLLDMAVIKIGHTDDRFNNPEFMQDGEPSYGQVTNLRVEDDEDGSVLIGDYINVPEELAEVMASAYPYRSVELDFGVELRDADGKTVAAFDAVLTAVSLLGSAPPAVSGLGAIHQAFTRLTSAGRVAAAKFTTGNSVVKFALAGGHTYGSLRSTLEAALRARISNDEWAWVVDLDDTNVFYEHETGASMLTYQEAFTIQEDGAVLLSGEPVQVVSRKTFEPVAGTATDTAPVPQPMLASRESKTVKPSTVAATERSTSHTSHKEDDMALSEQQLQKLRELGVSEDVTDEQLLEALGEEAAPAGEPEAEAAAQEAAEAEAEAAAGAQAPAQPVAASRTVTGLPETVSVSAAAFNQLQERNQSLEARLSKWEGEQAKERRDKVISAALAAGKMHPSEKAAFRNALDTDEQSITALIEARHPAYPTQELGNDNAAFSHQGKDAVAAAQAETDSKYFGRAGK